MYQPQEFRPTGSDDYAVAIDVIRRTPLGVMVSMSSDRLEATHLPFIVSHGGDDDEVSHDPGESGRPPVAGGIRLISHGSALNGHLRGLADGDDVLVVFHGPDAYVSGGWYVEEPDVPTWNYVAVHMRGRYRGIRNESEVRTLLEHTVRFFERDRADSSWTLAHLQEALISGLARGVIAFVLEVYDVESTLKLSQDKVPVDFQEVRRRLPAESVDGQSVAEAMSRYDVRSSRSGERS